MNEGTTGWFISKIHEVSVEALEVLKDILKALGGTTNAEAWESGRVLVEADDEPKQLPSIIIPDGMHLVVSALPDNAHEIYISHSKDTCSDENRRRGLSKEGGVELRINSADLVWVIGRKDDGVSWVCERRLR